MLTIIKVNGKKGWLITPKEREEVKKLRLKGLSIAIAENNFKSPPAKKPVSQSI